MGKVETNRFLKDLLCNIITEINECSIDENNIRVLLLSQTATMDAPIEKSSYYSEECGDEINGMIDEIRTGTASFKDLLQFSSVVLRECAECKGEGFSLYCLLMEEAVNYYGVIQYVLREIGRSARYSQLADEGRLRMLSASLDLKNRAILMEKYVQSFLQDQGLPAAELLIELSAQKYEGSESEARIYIEDSKIKDICRVYMLDRMGEEERILKSGKLRTIRKLMEISKRKALHLLASQDMCIVGMLSFDTGNEEAETEINEQNRYICFNGYMQWSVYVKGKEEICYKQGKYYINNSSGKDIYMMETDKFEQRVINKEESISTTMVAELVTVLREQSHGTTVIITDDEKEAERLCKVDRGILIAQSEQKPFRLEDGTFDKERILSVTGIDGALFMNLDGTCTALGVIVDGIACEKGNPGRGARYNSIYNYIRQKKDDNVYVALIFSEDGGVDIIDNFDVRKRQES